MRYWINAFNYLSSFGQKLLIDKVGQNVGHDYGKRNTWNPHKREAFYKAARDLRKVRSGIKIKLEYFNKKTMVRVRKVFIFQLFST